ncbi:MAG TPA: LPS export ABC transporter ATP-binding protein [Candidatus Hydrogenedens sp.]|nr:LPS export ABC transporter ATP-binding protein [Candidatus Hydrogenedens sp.]HOK09967.1 LPS export ABC transporter ATP-binding protein [Candidatus Hydrogenedens sp.]HOL19698.1 LPS export ABC transporter ATP-binding protein [Candidatus Hydrogenedens sp.]HPP59942.1 LPS export ABC transporter ATP-binding protein [Candidatus Hydrogenedens sp.]
MDRQPLLETKELVKSFRKRVVVRNVSLSLCAGEVVGLLGPNGAGKTTTFNMVVGLLKPDSGNVFFQNQDITTFPMYRRARFGIAYLAQEPSVFRNLTVEQNLLAILEFLPGTETEHKERARQLLKELNIEHLANQYAYTLSGGERRKTEIARALVTQPKIFLLDEPFAGIDPIAISELQNMVIDLKNRGIGVLITDHNVRDTLAITDRAYIISEGQVICTGTAEQVSANEHVRKVYLGEQFRLTI